MINKYHQIDLTWWTVPSISTGTTKSALLIGWKQHRYCKLIEVSMSKWKIEENQKVVHCTHEADYKEWRIFTINSYFSQLPIKDNLASCLPKISVTLLTWLFQGSENLDKNTDLNNVQVHKKTKPWMIKVAKTAILQAQVLSTSATTGIEPAAWWHYKRLEMAWGSQKNITPMWCPLHISKTTLRIESDLNNK